MKRLLLILAAIVATGGIAATPAVAGLAGNPSFSHQIPVPVPSQAATTSQAPRRCRWFWCVWCPFRSPELSARDASGARRAPFSASSRPSSLM
jgi:hypothetical protein